MSPWRLKLLATKPLISVKQVRYANENNIPFTTKSGGMSLYSTIGSNGMIIDLTSFPSNVAINKSAQTATLSGAVTAKTMSTELAKEGFCTAMPSANPIGAIPFFLNGGNSPLASRIGFGSDLIISARIVTAKGQILDVDETTNPDLLYATRGAGQFFGHVLELTIKIFPFEEALENPDGKIWTGIFVFPVSSAKVVAETMQSIVNDANHETNGLIVISSPPPHFRPAICIFPKLLGYHKEGLEKEVFKPLYDLNPLFTAGAPTPIQNVGDALAPVAAKEKGQSKKLVLTGLYEFDPEASLKVVDLWQDLVRRYPDTVPGTQFGIQWDTRFPKKPEEGFESANSLHVMRFWGNCITWCRGSKSAGPVQEVLEKVIEVLRSKQDVKEYVDFSNGVRGGPIERRYFGEDRREKLKALKREWDPEGKFSRELL